MSIAPSAPGQPKDKNRKATKIDKLDCSDLAKYWEGEKGKSVFGAEQKNLKITVPQEVNHSDSKLECEGRVRTDMFSGTDAKLIAELIDGDV